VKRQAKSSPRGTASAEIEIADRLHSAAIHILRRLRLEDVASGLSSPQLSALSVIVFAGPVTIGDLAAAEQVRPPTISRLVKGLEAQGLASRERDPEDARVQRISATAKGRRLLQEGRARRVERLAEQIARLSRGQRRALAQTVEILEGLTRPD
jgi:DNA-binding MarR family transcriptional regulator